MIHPCWNITTTHRKRCQSLNHTLRLVAPVSTTKSGSLLFLNVLNFDELFLMGNSVTCYQKGTSVSMMSRNVVDDALGIEAQMRRCIHHWRNSPGFPCTHHTSPPLLIVWIEKKNLTEEKNDILCSVIGIIFLLAVSFYKQWEKHQWVSNIDLRRVIDRSLFADSSPVLKKP